MIKKITIIFSVGIVPYIVASLLNYFVFYNASAEFHITFGASVLLAILSSFAPSVIFLISLAIVGLQRVRSLLSLGFLVVFYHGILLIIDSYLDLGIFMWVIMFVLGLLINTLLWKEKWSKSV